MLSLVNTLKNIEVLCNHIKNTIWRSLGIPTSIGVAKTKTLAKVANHYAKRVPAFKSICILTEDHRVNHALKRLSVGDVWGIGRQITKKLEGQGVLTAYDLKQVDPRCMRQNFSVVGERIVRELNGVSCLVLEDIEEPKKSTQVTRSFSKAITEFDELRQALATYTTRLGQKLREQGLMTKSVMVFIRTSKFRAHDPQYANSYTISLPSFVQDDISLIRAAMAALTQIYRKGFAYSKAGIMALDLIPKGQKVQLDLFSRNVEEPFQSAKLWEALDEINKRYGRGTLFSAACGKNLSWKDQKNLLSPPYTTSWKHLPVAFLK